MEMIEKKYFLATPIMDSDHARVADFAMHITQKTKDPVEKAVKLYYAVRDGIWYDPYSPFYLSEHYRASNVLKSGRGYCVSKAALLCALGRACEIPARVGFATVRNHLASRQLIEFLGTNLFVFHGFTEFYLNGCWIKATPAFNAELCNRHHVTPLEFDGRRDSIFHPYNSEKKPFMEYEKDHGSFADVPVDLILSAWKQAYGEKRVSRWIAAFETYGKIKGHNFDKEDVVSG